jgi:hypothetical protein
MTVDPLPLTYAYHHEAFRGRQILGPEADRKPPEAAGSRRTRTGTLRRVGRPVIDYTATHNFRISSDELWNAIGRTDRFASWWSWLQEFNVDGNDEGLHAGTVLRGVVAPPVPYRMRVSVEIVTASAPSQIEAAVHGDLEGAARLTVRPTESGSAIDISWKVEMMQAPMRLACRYAYPLIKWGHDRVVEMTVSSFRRHVEKDGEPDR